VAGRREGRKETVCKDGFLKFMFPFVPNDVHNSTSLYLISFDMFKVLPFSPM
jgi:hypothetical protein